MTRSRLRTFIRGLAISFIALVSCLNDTPPAPTSGSVHLSIAAAIAGQTGDGDRSVAIHVFYRRTGGADVDLPVTPEVIQLQKGTTSNSELTVSVEACFEDDLRDQASDDVCLLHIALQLLGADGEGLSGDQKQLILSRNSAPDNPVAFVLAQPQMLVAQNSVNFNATEQGTIPNPARVAVTPSSGLVLGTLTTTLQFTGVANWLNSTIAAATNEVVLQVTSTALPPGQHQAVVTVHSSRTDVPSRDIAVAFTVSARAPESLNLALLGSGNGSVASSPTGIACGRVNNSNTGVCSLGFAFGTQVTLTATPALNHSFTGWGGDCTGTGTCIVTLNQVRNVTATFTAPPAQQLNVTLAGTGGGGVTSAPAAINCTRSNNLNSGTCSSSFTFGGLVTLTQTPAANHAFTGWGGDCSGTGACNVTMNQTRNVTATFDSPAIGVAPNALVYNATQGGNPAPAGRTFQVTNTGAGTLNWSAVKSQPWLTVAPLNGTLSAGQSQTVTVTVTSSNLAPGNYSDSVVVSGSGAAPKAVAITLVVATLAPTIFNVAMNLVQLNDSSNCSNGGTSFIGSFSFSDPDGDATMAVAVIRDNFAFSQGTSGTIIWPTPGFFYNITGNGSSGTASVFLCSVFGVSTGTTNTFTLIDGAGHSSNSLGIFTPKPAGSNDPESPLTRESRPRR